MTYSRPGQKRNLKQFLEDQRKHEEDKQLKKNIILEEESKQEGREVHHPEICAKSEMMLANKRDEAVPVYDRLYGISKEKRVANILLDETPTSNISLLQEEQQQENTFAP